MNSVSTFFNEKVVEFEKETKKINEEITKSLLSSEKTWGNVCSARQTRTIF